MGDIKKIFQHIEKWSEKSEESLLNQLESLAEVRRREMERISTELICLTPQLAGLQGHLFNNYCPKFEADIVKKLEAFEMEANSIFPNDFSKGLQEIEFHLSSTAREVFMKGDIRIDLEFTMRNERHIELTKCLFLTSLKSKVYISDYGLNSLYKIDLTSDAENMNSLLINTSGDAGRSRIREIRGISLDPAGNILTSSSQEGKLEIFEPENGSHIRSLMVPGLKKAAGILLDFENRTLYIADTDIKAVLQYSVTEIPKN